jgi:hypothetical protein
MKLEGLQTEGTYLLAKISKCAYAQLESNISQANVVDLVQAIAVKRLLISMQLTHNS